MAFLMFQRHSGLTYSQTTDRPCFSAKPKDAVQRLTCTSGFNTNKSSSQWPDWKIDLDIVGRCMGNAEPALASCSKEISDGLIQIFDLPAVWPGPSSLDSHFGREQSKRKHRDLHWETEYIFFYEQIEITTRGLLEPQRGLQYLRGKRWSCRVQMTEYSIVEQPFDLDIRWLPPCD